MLNIARLMALVVVVLVTIHWRHVMTFGDFALLVIVIRLHDQFRETANLEPIFKRMDARKSKEAAQ